MKLNTKEIPVDWRKTLSQLNSQINDTYDNGMDNVLDRLGYEPKRTGSDVILPALSIFSAGLVVGAGLGLLFAPKRGDELRGDIKHRINDIRPIASLGGSDEDRYDDLRSKSSSSSSDLRAHHLDAIE